MAKGQTKQATEMSKNLYNQAPTTFSPVTTPLTGTPQEAKQGYETLASGQGLGGGEAGEYFNAATSSIGATNNVLQEQLNRQRAAQGEGAGGGEYAELSRLSAQQTADANLKAAVALDQQRAQREEFGVSGLAGLDQQLLQALGLQVGSQEQATAIMQNLSKNPGLFGNILNALGSVTGSYSSGPSGSSWSIGA